MELEQLRQLETIAQTGSISAAAKRMNISQPALSRSMKRLESEFGMELFTRTKNSSTLNDAGRTAVELAQSVIAEAERMRTSLKSLADSRRQMRIVSCAPAPLWKALPAFSELAPDAIVSTELVPSQDALHMLLEQRAAYAILPFAPQEPHIFSFPFMTERLFASLPQHHAFAKEASVRAEQLDGETFLLFEGIGIWRPTVEQAMPNAHFVTQKDYVIYQELSRTSPLPGFATDLSRDTRNTKGRILVPFEDTWARKTFHLCAVSPEHMDWLKLRLTAQA